MEIPIFISILGVLYLLARQDIMSRRISLLGIIVLFLLCCIYSLQTMQLELIAYRFLLNAAFSGVILVSGTLMVKVFRTQSAFKSLIGSGDYLFLFAISPLFSFESFLVFLNTSFTLVLIIFFFLKRSKIDNKKQSTVPLAGGLALCLILVLIAQITLPVELLNLVL